MRFRHGGPSCQKVNGCVIYYFNGHVVELQELLSRSYNFLADNYTKFRRVQSWLSQVGDNRDTSLMEDQRAEWLKAMETDRDKTVKLMTQLLKAGAEPLPAVDGLDSSVAAYLNTCSFRDAAVSAAGGEVAVNTFRVAALEAINEAILKTHAEAEAKALKHAFKAEQRAWQRFEQEYERMYMYPHMFDDEERPAQQAADAKAKAAQQAADVKAKLHSKRPMRRLRLRLRLHSKQPMLRLKLKQRARLPLQVAGMKKM